MSSYCSQLTQQSGTPLYGTASTFRVALLLEYAGAWNNKAVLNNNLPASIKHWIKTQQESVEDLRPIWIKRTTSGASKTLYVAATEAEEPQLYEINFERYEELLSLDVADILRSVSDLQPVDEKVVVVCTNGKHDLCCAKFGLPIFHALEAESGLTVWQSTHLGGHRYAATAFALPSGVSYGYLTSENVRLVAEAIRSEQIYLPCYRGRAGYPGVVNAADYFLRARIDQNALAALKLSSAVRNNNGWCVQFQNGSEQHYTVEVSESDTEPVISSCGDKPPKPQKHYQLLRFEIG